MELNDCVLLAPPVLLLMQSGWLFDRYSVSSPWWLAPILGEIDLSTISMSSHSFRRLFLILVMRLSVLRTVFYGTEFVYVLSCCIVCDFSFDLGRCPYLGGRYELLSGSMTEHSCSSSIRLHWPTKMPDVLVFCRLIILYSRILGFYL